MGPRLVAVLKDEEGKVISSPEAAAAIVWERKFLEAFSGMAASSGMLWRSWTKARTREPLRLLKARRNQWSREGGVVLSLLSDALATTKQEKAVGPDALPAEFLRAGGISLLPHLARLAARAMAVGVPKNWRGGRMAPYPEEGDAPLYLAAQPRYYVRQCGGQSCGQGSAFAACWASGGGGRRAPAWGRATRTHRVSIACLQAFPQRSCCGGASHGLVQCFLLCSSGAGFGSHFDLFQKGLRSLARWTSHTTSRGSAWRELIRSEDTVIKRQEVAKRWRKMAADFHKEPWF